MYFVKSLKEVRKESRIKPTGVVDYGAIRIKLAVSDNVVAFL